MRKILALLFLVFVGPVAVTGCSTLGGAIQGAGEDLQKAGQWIRSN
jgi:predicted small secreted protein